MRVSRIAFLSLILTLICYLHPAFGFEYQRSRWRLADLPIPCYLNTASMPGELAATDVEQAVIQSMEAWNRAAGIQIFEYAGRMKVETALADDGWNAISFVSTDWLKVTDGLPADGLTAGTTCTWSLRDPIGRPPRHGFTKSDFLRAFDIAINAETYRWTIGARPDRYDIQSVITHELGHVLSLGHPDDDPRAPDAPTMVERMYPNDTKLRTLEPDDIAGVQSIYRKVSGVLREDEHWENMIWVDGDVTVPRGVSLKITPSTPQTIVHFSPGAKLIIEGGLTVDSSTLERMRFTGIDGAQWGGLDIHANDRACQIAGSIFEGTAVALALTSAADVSIKDCEFRRNPIGIQGVSVRNVSITGCTFDNAKTAMTLMSTIDGTVENCEFHGNPIAVQIADGQNLSIGGVFRENGVGVDIRSSREVKITQSTLEQNNVGVRLIDTKAHLRASTFTENTIGVETYSDQPTFLRENSITHNEIGIRVVRGAVDLGRSPDDLGQNNLFSNAVWNLKLEAPLPTPIFAQGNYWGALTIAEIDRTIRDDDEDANLPPVQFQPTLDELVQTGLNFEFVGVEVNSIWSAEGLVDAWTFTSSPPWELPSQDGRKIYERIAIDEHGEERIVTVVTPQNGYSLCGYTRYDAHFRVVNLDPRIEGFTIQLYLSSNADHDLATAIQLIGPGSRPRIDEVRAYGGNFTFRQFTIPDLVIDSISKKFYIWAHILIDGQKEPIIVPGKWIEIYEELADLVGTIHEIPSASLPGEEINVRYSIKNYGRKEEGNQTVRFYLSKTWERASPPQPDYSLLPEINLPTLEGEWTSKLTIPADVPFGNYYLWMMVDADNDVLECNSTNNPATYLASPIRIGDFEDETKPRAVQPHSKRPIVWGALKTALFQNFPNPFNPETWIPYQLAGETPVQITIYNAQGQLVRRIDLGVQSAGRYIDKGRAAYWDGRNERGEVVSSGVYWYQLRTVDSQSTKRMVIRK